MLTRGYHVLLQQDEIHLAIIALALCLDAAVSQCQKQRCPAILAKTTILSIRVNFETLLRCNTLVGGSSSKSTHSLFPGPLLDSHKHLMSFTTTLCHDFRTHYLAKHSRARMCLVVSEIRSLGLVLCGKYLFMYRRTVSALTASPSLCCSILASWGHWSPCFTPPLNGGSLLGTPRALGACPP
jgi:hypothetical protein